MKSRFATIPLLLLINILVSGLVPGRLSAEPEPSATVLAVEDTGLSTVGSMAVSPNGRRVYVGAETSYDQTRLNLGVVTLDEQGRAAGESRRYVDSEVPLPGKTHKTVGSLLVHPGGRKLYFGDNYGTPGSPAAPEVTKVLTVYDLDANGEPVGKPRGYESGNPQRQIQALALHPRLNRLYLTGWGSGAVPVHDLDAAGEPVGQPKTFPIGENGKFSVAVSEDGARLYLGTYPATLEIVNLDAAGYPTGAARPFKAAGQEGYLQFVYTPRALYLKGTPEQGNSLAEWPLDQNGAPVGDPKLYANISARAIATDPSYKTVWLGKALTFNDAFTDKTIVEGTAPVAFDAAGGLGGAGREGARKFRQSAVAMAVGAGGRAVLLTQPLPRGFLGNRFKGYRMRITVLEARLRSGAIPATIPVTAQFGHANVKEAKFGDVAVGQSSPWVDLDPYLRDQTVLPRGWPMPVRILGQPGWWSWWPDASLGLMKLRIEVAQGEKVLKTLEETVTASQMVMMMPHYGFESPNYNFVAVADFQPEQAPQHIELFSDYVDRYLKEARAWALRPEDRPKLFIINSNNVIGGQANVEQMKKEAETLALLGFNTANVYGWEGISREQIDAVFDSFGLNRRSLATYTPPFYFDFDQERMNPAALQKWAEDQAKLVSDQSGGKNEDVVDFVMSDEPGWYYPALLEEVKKNPQWLEGFRTYLKGKGLQPADLSQANWSAVFPIGASGAILPQTPVTTRRLFYWTMRFFPESASAGHRQASLALEKAFGHPMFVSVNWNNFFSRWYTASPNEIVANNPEAVPDSGMGSMDWMESGRQSAHTLWTEDWFSDQEAQQWSFHADILRSSSLLGDQQVFGSYIIGEYTGGLREEAGTTYKMLSLIGHGAKEVSMWAFGPAPIAGGNGWSENLDAYRSIANAHRIVGKSELVLHPGRRARGKVAIFLPSTSNLWDTSRQLPYYQHEIISLHYGLTHAGYTIDFVDEKDLEQGALGKREYSALYLTGPNVTLKAQQMLASWVREGGTVAVMPGAGTADELNTPTTALDEMLGVTGRTAVRDAATYLWQPAQPSGDSLVLSETLGKGEVSLLGPVAKLQPKDATVLAKLTSGQPGITSHTYGKGRALAYSFFPGAQYWMTAERGSLQNLPRDWGAEQRAVVVEAARLAKTPKPVELSMPVVEACLLQSDKGIAVVLLNWTDQPIKNLTVTLPNVGKFRKVSSVQGGVLHGAMTGNSMKITLSLKNVDVLMIE